MWRWWLRLYKLIKTKMRMNKKSFLSIRKRIFIKSWLNWRNCLRNDLWFRGNYTKKLIQWQWDYGYEYERDVNTLFYGNQFHIETYCFMQAHLDRFFLFSISIYYFFYFLKLKHSHWRRCSLFFPSLRCVLYNWSYYSLCLTCLPFAISFLLKWEFYLCSHLFLQFFLL